jgi:hypothetical protein
MPETRSESTWLSYGHVFYSSPNNRPPGTARTMGEGLVRLRLFGRLTPEGWRQVTENRECTTKQS